MRETENVITKVANDLFNQYFELAMRIIKNPELISPDFVIGTDYINRWWLAKIESHHDESRLGVLKEHTNRNENHNCYLHQVTGSDDDRALHDHPWDNASFLLSGSYIEHTPTGKYQRDPGEVIVRNAEDLHRLEVRVGPVWSLFITGPKIRDWGFMCPNGRWVHWREFTGYDGTDSYLTGGPGCGEE